MPFDYLPPLLVNTDSKIILLVLDGLGGLPIEPDGPTELEAAQTPHMDKLAAQGTLGQTIPISPGITPGSGPAHLALFGYDPFVHSFGRGALSAAGVGLNLRVGDVAARGNFCTLDSDGNILDRRAGRISSEESAPLIERLQSIQIEGVEVIVKQVKEYRFVIQMIGDGLNANVEDTDPQRTGVPPLPVMPRDASAEKTAHLFNGWISQATKTLSDQPAANGVTLRGFATHPGLIPYQQAYGIKAACVAVYPMYRGVARLVGMDIIEFNGDSPQDEFEAVKDAWADYDFFFVHIKKTDSKGEDGDFAGKVEVIEGVDRAIPKLLDLEPDVLIITGDHSTPSLFRSHSWHPVPLLLWAPMTALPDVQKRFGERNCALGGLGTFSAMHVMPLGLAHAKRLVKYGA